MKIRFYNARILTMADDAEIIQGEIHIEDNRIRYVGKTPEGNEKAPAAGRTADKNNGWDREIDAQGNLIMPGFKNAHTHSAMTFLRSYADDLPLQDWLNKQVFPMEAKLTPEHIYELSRLAILEYLTSGITANMDMYLHPEMIVKASVDCGFRTVISSAVNNFNGETVEAMEKDYQTYNSYHDLISYQMGFHAEYTTAEPLLKKISALAAKYHASIFTHNSETETEVRECIERTGMTPTVYLNSLGLFDYGGGGYHCVHMTEEDLNIFAEKNLSVVTNPASNLKLASGIAPVQEMINRGINLAIGTDGPASNNCLDMFREMFLTTALAKLKNNDAAAVDADKVLYMATVGGARAMSLKDCDTLEAGKAADLIMIDLHQPNMQPLNNITKNLVYSGSKQNVILTMVNGRILYEKGQFYIGTDPEEIYAKANEIINAFR